MQEQLVTFETAKLAKEKGFDLKTQSYYGRCFPETEFEIFCDNLDVFGGDFSCYAPTQSLLQKWLREKHSIDIIITSKVLGYGYLLYKRYPPKNITNHSIFETYEQALEAALLEALEIIDKKDEK